jgi:hypothetical protein
MTATHVRGHPTAIPAPTTSSSPEPLHGRSPRMTQRTEATGGLVEADGATWYRIDGLEAMEPFLLTVVSDSDLWMFVSSHGPLTAGRVDADHALLPYETDDRLHRAVGICGPLTLVIRTVDGERELWQPFGPRLAPGCTRSLAKHVLGTALRFEEANTLGLRFRMTWEPSRAYGWVRTVELVDEAGTGADVEVLDGLLDVMPAGVDAVTEQLTSNLVDAYKRSEAGLPGTAALYALESLITDRAEPAESLAATMVWSTGLDGAEVHLDERIVDDIRRGDTRTPVDLLTGRRGAYLLRAPVHVPAGGPWRRGCSSPTPGSATPRSTTGCRWRPTPRPASSWRTTSPPGRLAWRLGSRTPTASSTRGTPSRTPTTCRTCCSTPCAAGSSSTATGSRSTTCSTSCVSATDRCSTGTRRGCGPRALRWSSASSPSSPRRATTRISSGSPWSTSR